MVNSLRYKRFSIQRKLFVFQFALLLLVVLLVSTASVYLIVQQLKTVQQRHLELVSHDIIFHLKSELKARVSELEMVAEHRAVSTYAESFQEGPLEEVMVNYEKSFSLLSYVNKYGMEEVKVISGEISQEYQNRYNNELFKNACSVPGKVFMRTVAYSSELEGPSVEMAIMRQEYFGDRFLGVLFAEIPLETMIEGVCHECDQSSYYIMIDAHGKMLATSRVEFLRESVVDPSLKTSAKALFADAMALRAGFSRADVFNHDSFVSYGPVPDLSCAVLVGLHYQDFMQVPWQLIQTVSLIFIVILLVGTMASYKVSKSITEPIKTLVEAVGLVAQGDFSRKVSIRTHDELEELAEKFNLMTDDLDSFLQREKQLIEDKAKATTSLLKAKKMEAIGMMAGGVAHDLNNILAGITGYPDLLLMKLPPESDLRKPITRIRESGFRAAAVVADLLTVARGAATVKEAISLNTIIEGYLDSAEFQKLYSLYPEVLVHAELAPDLHPVKCSRVHLQKVIMNLVGNAVEAINGAGSVVISTVNMPINSESESKLEEMVVMKIADDGPGIVKADLDHIFEPFYSRKVMGRSGTGLGLTIVWNTVKDHAGDIEVESSIKGTTFNITLPITNESVMEYSPEVGLEELCGTGTVLVVDDEPQQLEVTAQMLNTLGYTVELASSGEEAIEYLKSNQVDLLLLDMIMKPGMSGREAYEEIVKIYPCQKAIIVSGFSVSEDVDRVIELGAGGFLRKPFGLRHLGAAVHKELHELRLVSTREVSA